MRQLDATSVMPSCQSWSAMMVSQGFYVQALGRIIKSYFSMRCIWQRLYYAPVSGPLPACSKCLLLVMTGCECKQIQ